MLFSDIFINLYPIVATSYKNENNLKYCKVLLLTKLVLVFHLKSYNFKYSFGKCNTVFSLSFINTIRYSEVLYRQRFYTQQMTYTQEINWRLVLLNQKADKQQKK